MTRIVTFDKNCNTDTKTLYDQTFDKKMNQYRVDGQSYIAGMWQSAIYEVREKRTCWLIESILEACENDPNTQFHMWDVSVLQGVLDYFYFNKNLKISDFWVPYFDQSWHQSRRTFCKLTTELYNDLTKFCREYVKSGPANETTDAGQAPRKPAGSEEEKNAPAPAEKQAAESPRENPPAAAGPKAGGQDAQQILRDARAEAAVIRQNAERQRMLEEARAQADRIRQEAEAEISRNKEKSRREAERQRELIRDAHIAEGADPAAAAQYFRIREEIAQEMREMQKRTMASVQETVEQLESRLTDFRASIPAVTRECREKLYIADYKALAAVYWDFYQYVNQTMDAKMQKLDSNDPAQTAQRDQMEKIQASLTRLLNRFEKAMSQLGLVFFRPQPGEMCDDILHQDEDEEETTNGLPVLQCVSPGIRVSGESGEVLFKAGVKLDHGQDAGPDEPPAAEQEERDHG